MAEAVGHRLAQVRAGPRSSRASACLIDWQFATGGNPLSDVAFLLYSSLSPTSWTAWQTTLLDTYHSTLISHSDVDVTLADCEDAFQRSEAGATLVALATLDGFTAGMNAAQLARLAPR